MTQVLAHRRTLLLASCLALSAAMGCSSADSNDDVGNAGGSGGLSQGTGGQPFPGMQAGAGGSRPFDPQTVVGTGNSGGSGGVVAATKPEGWVGGGAPSTTVKGNTGGMVSSNSGGTLPANGGRVSEGGRLSTGGASTLAPTGAGGAAPKLCPYTGQVSYTLAQAASPTADELATYAKITRAMDKAISYYNCYTPISKKLSVSYVPSVATADGNSNGSIRFGSQASMNAVTAMHEISHTVGIGTAPAWASLVVNKQFTGSHAIAQLLAIPDHSATTIGADTQHFWPYGLNYESEGAKEVDLINHCSMVMAIREDLGLK